MNFRQDNLKLSNNYMQKQPPRPIEINEISVRWGVPS